MTASGSPGRAVAPRPTPARLPWFLAAACLLLIVGLGAAGQAAAVRLAIPGGATLVAIALYLRRPIAYLHFTLWTWFLTPLVRRLVDWRFGFEDHNLVLLAPLLVSAVAGLTLLRERPRSGTVRLTPFWLCIAGILYGFAVGVLRWGLHTSEAKSAGEIFYALLNWLAPLLFGLHLCIRWRRYREHRDAIQKSFLWAVILLGLYGVYQCVHPPAWDTTWLEHMIADLGDESFGRPEPYQIRVWSTLNSPGVFANVLMAGLLLLFSVRSRLKPLAVAAGYSAFLLTLVRTSWLGWLVGLVVLARSSRGREIPRLLASLLLLPVLVVPLLLNAQFATAVSERLQTFQSTGHDESLLDRTEEYRALLTSLAADPFGEGVNNAETWHGYIMDSGIIRLLYGCGWLGTALLLGGLVLGMRSIPSGRLSGDPMASVYHAVLLAMMCELLSGNCFVGSAGAILWTCIGLGVSLRSAERIALPGRDSIAGANHNATAMVA